MLKKILLVLALVCFLGTFAFILKMEKCLEVLGRGKDSAVTEITTTATIARFRKEMKYATTGEERAITQYCIGQCYWIEKDYATARAEYAKVLAMTDADPCRKSSAQLQIGHCYRKEGKDTEAQEAYLKLCLEQASTGHILHIRRAFNRLDPLKIGKEKYLKILDALISGIKATPENAEFLSMLKSKQKELLK